MFGFTSEKTKLKKENLRLKIELKESQDLVRCLTESAEKIDDRLFGIQIAFNKGLEDTPSLKRYTVIKKLNNLING